MIRLLTNSFNPIAAPCGSTVTSMLRAALGHASRCHTQTRQLLIWRVARQSGKAIPAHGASAEAMESQVTNTSTLGTAKRREIAGFRLMER
jgi:hypothetical protein